MVIKAKEINIGALRGVKDLLAFHEDLLEEEGGVEINSGKLVSWQAKVRLKFGTMYVDTWIDTGAMYSVIREDLYGVLKKSGYVPEILPVTNLKMYGALGKVSQQH